MRSYYAIPPKGKPCYFLRPGLTKLVLLRHALSNMKKTLALARAPQRWISQVLPQFAN